MIKIKYVVLVLLSLVFCTFLFNQSDAKAYNCWNITSSVNESIRHACNVMKDEWDNGSGHWWGALWLSGSNNSYDLSDDILTTKTTGIINVYLRGLAICSASSYCSDSVAECGYIKILHTNVEYPKGSNIGDAWWGLRNWGAIVSLPKNFEYQASFSRPIFGKSETLYGVSSQAISLSIDELKKPGNYDKKIETDSTVTYITNVKPYRVGDYNTPYSGGSAENSTVRITIPRENIFSGRSYINGANDTGYTRTSKDAGIYYINNCSPTAGCAVTFNHNLKRNAGNSYTTYSVTRSSNYDRKGVTNANLVNNATFNAAEQTVKTDSVTLYPGQVVCESLKFDNNGTMTGGTGQVTTVCASALGNAQPPDPNIDGPSGDQAFVNIKVKNIYASSAYRSYQRTVYAKPTDRVSWRATYNPVLQYTAYLIPNQMRINTGTIHNGEDTNMRTMFNRYRGGLEEWRNGFSIVVGSSTISNDNYNAGDTTPRAREKLDATLIRNRDVGEAGVNGQAITSYDSNKNKTTPGQITFTRNGNSNLGDINTESRSQTAYVKVPYNFENAIHKPMSSSDDPNDESDDDINNIKQDKTVYAGEKIAIGFKIDVKPRKNNVTNGIYATVVKDAKWHLGLCYNGICNNRADYIFDEDTTENLNQEGNYGGMYGIERGSSINIPDVKAGSKVCVIAEVWPANSGLETNTSVSGYTNAWVSSRRSCYTVAKKPSIQLWGGNVYSRGNLTTATAVKNNLNGYPQYPYKIRNANGTFVFGSWGELGVVANGSVQGFGSGASMGYNRNDGGNVTWPNHTYKAGDNTTFNYYGAGNTAAGGAPGGSGKENYCDRAPLTIPNEGCTKTGSTMGLSTSVGATQAANDKKSIIDVLGLSGTEFSGELNSTIVGPSIAGNETKTFGTKDGDITITSDLVYFDTGDLYRSYRDMPKLIIYAKNIKINCNVERIDALLIADNEVNTCANSNNINNRDNSRQLFVNGAIIANRMVANRTYGAATGANSIVPAEIINFDPTLYEFGNSAIIDDDVASRLDATYIHELAPRL